MKEITDLKKQSIKFVLACPWFSCPLVCSHHEKPSEETTDIGDLHNWLLKPHILYLMEKKEKKLHITKFQSVSFLFWIMNIFLTVLDG